VLPERWLLAEWPAGSDEPVKYWLSTCPPTRRWSGSCSWPSFADGLSTTTASSSSAPAWDHYEGRTYRGLHHHLTCVTVAHAFLTCWRLARAGPPTDRPHTAAA
jgi:SRSO17 transposase